MDVAVLGAGAWGTVLASLAEGQGNSVALWEFDAAEAAALARDRRNARCVPGFRLPARVTVTDDAAAAVRGRPLVVVAVPSETMGDTLRAAAPGLQPGAVIACATKGLEPGTGRTMAEVIAAAVPGRAVVMLSGPTFAEEIARRLPAAVAAASTEGFASEMVRATLGSERFRIYTSDDVVGVSLGGALKNVIAIAVGCCDGVGLGQNARAALITRGLAEMSRLAVRQGAHPLTMSGLAGLGDLVLTCTGELSRNRQVGLALGRGEALPDIVARLGHVAEGIGTSAIARSLADRLGVEMPITRATAAVLHDAQSPREAIGQLLSRDFRPERG
jgi:glycerol-3-phosphate dehydrogenase (NAD(P)+)